jgi:hypothetical protein
LGAIKCFGYHGSNVTEHILAIAPVIPYIMHCIDSLHGTPRPWTKLAGTGRRSSSDVAMLPVVVNYAGEPGGTRLRDGY